MKILTKINDQVIVQLSQEEFKYLEEGMQKTISHFMTSHRHPSVGPTMTFKYGGQSITKSYEDLAFEDYRGPFIPD